VLQLHVHEARRETCSGACVSGAFSKVCEIAGLAGMAGHNSKGASSDMQALVASHTSMALALAGLHSIAILHCSRCSPGRHQCQGPALRGTRPVGKRQQAHQQLHGYYTFECGPLAVQHASRTQTQRLAKAWPMQPSWHHGHAAAGQAGACDIVCAYCCVQGNKNLPPQDEQQLAAGHCRRALPLPTLPMLSMKGKLTGSSTRLAGPSSTVKTLLR
jgi:hypothetical protein